MNYRRFVAALLLSTPLAAIAAPAVMVQFGSFETMTEAQKRLSDVKSAHGSTLSALTLGVKEVKLPPDNLTVYRTQAGPVDSRATAQSICSKLSSSGDECYVVETVMAAPSTVVADAVTPVTATISNLPSTSTLADAATRPVTVAPLKVEAPVLESPTLKVEAPTISAPTLAKPEVITNKPSFWSRVNPFDGENKPVTLKTEEAPVVSLAAPENLGSVPTVKVEAPTTPVIPMPTAPEVVTLTPAIETPKLASNAITLTPQTYVDAPTLPLLPPPPPLTARDRDFIDRSLAAPVVQKPEIVVAQPTITTPAIKPLEPIDTTVVLPPVKGTVKVEEAKRVPLTESHPQPTTPTQPPLLKTSPHAVPQAVSLLPSSTLGQKTLWAQIGQFNNAQEAFAFWENYRNTHPDFPVVRLRVTSSIQQQMHGNDRVSLRVGPFARDGFIRNLCATVSPTSNLRCGFVTDMGVSANAHPRSAGYLNGSRYKR